MMPHSKGTQLTACGSVFGLELPFCIKCKTRDATAAFLATGLSSLLLDGNAAHRARYNRLSLFSQLLIAVLATQPAALPSGAAALLLPPLQLPLPRPRPSRCSSTCIQEPFVSRNVTFIWHDTRLICPCNRTHCMQLRSHTWRLALQLCSVPRGEAHAAGQTPSSGMAPPPAPL
jgi:hypothetical protein